jgi:hypothetical protein
MGWLEPVIRKGIAGLRIARFKSVFQPRHALLGVANNARDDELMKAFQGQVRLALSTMTIEQAESDEAISENARQRLKELAGSAAILGADQFSTLYARLKGITSITRRLSGGPCSSGARDRAHGQTPSYA